jgi:acid phosphatase (class A)
VLALAWPAVLPLLAAPPAAVALEPDWAALAGTFPQPGTRQADEELAIMLWMQRIRTHADVERAKAEVMVALPTFGDVLGPRFDAAAHPRTAALLDLVRKDAHSVVGPLKDRFARPRPFMAFPAVTPVVPREATFSFPSGHAFLGGVYGAVLAELVPARREALLERGSLIGNDRVLAGMHWPSDVDAGHRLGAAFAAHWLSAPAHRKLVEDVRAAEWR